MDATIQNGIALNPKSILTKVDTTPTADSNNPVSSDGVKTYVDQKDQATNIRVDTLNTQIAASFFFKGSSTFAELPASGNTVNDTYYVTDSDKECWYSWNGTDWIKSSMSQADYAGLIAQLKADISAEYSTSKTYKVGDYCLYGADGVLYICKIAVTTAGAFDSNKWQAISFGEAVGDLVIADDTQPTSLANKIWLDTDPNPDTVEVITEEDLGNIVAGEFDSASVYAVGDYCIHDAKLYVAKTATAANDGWIAARWQQVTVMGTINDQVGELKTQLNNTNNFIEYLNNISDSGNTLGIELGGRKSASRIYSAPIKTLGDSITIATSDNTLQFALASGDASTTISAWRTPSTITTKDQWTNGLSLWIQRIDRTEISDADIADIINSFSVTYNLKTVKEQVLTTESIAYISTAGSDSADGSELTPFATVNTALEKGYKNIFISGGVYKQKIDLSKRRGAITLSAVGRATPIFKDPDTVEITSATQYSGNVYVADADANIFNNISWIFQDGVEDVSTGITYAERLPEQRGRLYRCTDTKIVRCTAESFSAAITEIQGASDYRFYYDNTNDKLYFSAPSTDFANHPICCGSGSVGLFENGTNENSVHVVGIECKYIRLNLDYTTDSIAEYCKVSCAYAPTLGQYTWDEAVNAKFLSCEAALSAGSKTTSDGDGFNAHYATDTGDKFSHISGAELVNCWAHDNRDDGYSEHQRSESTVIGGLYEYNSKGGVTPANGCHCVCIGVVSRYNYNGFVCCNGANSQEGGIGTQLLCIDCTAYGNNGSGTGHGFDCFSSASDYTHNTMTCINCRAYNNLRCGYSIGHNAEQYLDYGKLVDCKASNNGVSAYRAYGTIEIITNTDIVSV